MSREARSAILAALILVAASLAAALFAIPAASAGGGDGTPTVVSIQARQFAFTPGVVHVPEGARIRVVLSAEDVTHGLYLEGHDVSLTSYPGRPVTAEFVADRPGRYTFYCTATCGQLHPFMVGELVVEPNHPLYLAFGLLGLGAVVGTALGTRAGGSGEWRLDLTAWRPLERVLRSRALQQGTTAALLAGFTLVILAGLTGSPVGSHNSAVVLVWIAWWGALKLVLIPFGGRAWCAVCPLPAPGEWLQRRTILGRRLGRPLGLGRAWPRQLRGIWLAIALLLLVGVASAPILTSPTLTALLLGGMALLALGLSLVFRGRAFCRYLCPVGSFVGLYSLAAPLGVRVREPEGCRCHREKECLRGSAEAHGCPWLTYPGTLRRNVECGLCLECLRGCPKGNVALCLRAPGADLVPGDGASDWPRSDEAFGALAMVALGVVYTVVFLGPWGDLKRAALLGTPGDALAHAALVVGSAALLAPGLWVGLAWLARLVAARPDVPIRHIWAAFAYALVPLGLAAWIAFTIGFVLSGGTYVASTLADPLGWGWDLAGLATAWRPLAAGARPWLQAGTWAVGLAWSASVAMAIARRAFGKGDGARRAGVVVSLGLLLVTGGLAWLGLG